MSGASRTVRARLAGAAGALARRRPARVPRIRLSASGALARRRPAPVPRVRLSAPGAERRTLDPADPAATALVAAAEGLLSAAQRASRE